MPIRLASSHVLQEDEEQEDEEQEDEEQDDEDGKSGGVDTQKMNRTFKREASIWKIQKIQLN